MFDAIIVGARCGGSPLAMRLARAGHKVLLVDRMARGSDIMSTHYLKRSGAAHLKSWGLLDAVKAADTPAIRELNFHLDGTVLSGTAPAKSGVDADYTPRRYILDSILTDAAVEAGAELRDRFTVHELLFDGDRVAGIRGQDANGRVVEERAKIVVGADGVNSFVANAVHAPKHVDAGIHTCGYYAYHSGMRDRDDAASLYVLSDARRFAITFPTNDELDMVFLFWPTEEARTVRKDLSGAFEACVGLIPELEARVSRATRETKIAGTPLLPNFFRKAHGPGWALVGDAALHRDPITAQGITNAFTHAEILAQELLSAFAGEKSIDRAAADYDARQFEALKPMFDYTVHLALLNPPLADVQSMIPALQQDPKATSAFIGAFLGSVPLEEAFPRTVVTAFGDDVRRCQEDVRHAA